MLERNELNSGASDVLITLVGLLALLVPTRDANSGGPGGPPGPLGLAIASDSHPLPVELA